uniref:Uncharacterized protein n=1 Tax=Cucumis melo TaxID=3656 RepID=A0A9I9DH01_CUCME
MKKKTFRALFEKRRAENVKRKPKKNEGEEGKENELEGPLSSSQVNNSSRVPRGTHPTVQMEELFPRGDRNKI